jgi:hypothetical protein
MENESNKILISIVVTAVIVGGGVYYFLNNDSTNTNTDTTTSSQTESVNLNKTSKEYAVMGRQAWSAFECASLASVTGDVEEQERLFLFGYEQGKKFLAAAEAEKISDEDYSSEVPIGVSLLLGGPSADFMLGRIFEGAQENALDDIYTKDLNDTNEIRKIRAENKFRDGNCQLVGK